MINLKAKPFNLNEEQIKWVYDTLNKMTLDEKIGQLFVPIGLSTDPYYLNSLVDNHIGGLFFRDGDFEEMRITFDYIQKKSKIPLLTPANLEYGGNGAIIDGTAYATQMAVAATNNPKNAYTLGKISAEEGKQIGVNWSFAPVIDIDLNFRNPIMNVRTYGDNTETVIENAKEYTKAFHDNNMMTSIKHFPGDGVDERDQHLLTSVNSLSKKAWDKTFGRAYKELIDFGSKAVMAGHISFPAYSGSNLPASLDKDLLNGLLREELGFNGLVITDATPMVGFTAAMKRKEGVPQSIASGCDMFLFNKDFAEDIQYMKEGYESGILTDERLTEAVTRILATKASLGLNNGIEEVDLIRKDFSEEQKEVANQAITLVKDEENVLPMLKTKNRLLVQILGGFDSNARVEVTLVSALEKEGFEVTVYQKETNFYELQTVDQFTSKYDYVLYAANIENSSNQTTARINWHTLFGLGNNLPWFVKELPTILVSFGNPYHTFDAPMIPTVVNAYCNYDHFIEAAVQKLIGASEFKGKSPINPFCDNHKLRELINNEDK